MPLTSAPISEFPFNISTMVSDRNNFISIFNINSVLFSKVLNALRKALFGRQKPEQNEHSYLDVSWI